MKGMAWNVSNKLLGKISYVAIHVAIGLQGD